MIFFTGIVTSLNILGANSTEIASTVEVTKQAVAWYRDYYFWGNTASIVSLVVSGLVFWNVRKIKNDFLFNARAPELTDKLDKLASQISSLLNDFDKSKEEIILEVGKSKITLKTLLVKLDNEPKKSASNIIKLIERNASNISTLEKKSVDKIYLEIRLFVEEMNNLIKDKQWR